METLTQLISICPLLLIAGIIDGISGGGGIIALPSYIMTGMPLNFAYGCNKLQSCIGTSASLFRYAKSSYVDFKIALICAPLAMLGSHISTKIMMNLDDSVKNVIIIAAMVFIISLTLLVSKIKSGEKKRVAVNAKNILICFAIGLGLGLYDGFFGPGGSTVALMLFSIIFKYDMRTGSGNGKLIVVVSNLAATANYIASGNVLYRIAIPATIANIIGRNIIDGSGNDGYISDIAIENGRIAAIGKGLDGAARTINAEGLTVTPGFIDSHSHSDNAILTHPDQTEKIEQGITTAVCGQCGSTEAPISRDITPEKARDIAGFGKNTEIFRTMGTFLGIAKDVPQGINAVCLVGHGALRKAVMGMENREPSKEELEKMKLLLKEGIEGGARGIISHLKPSRKPNWGKVKTTLKMIDEANAEGLDIYCDVYPYIASNTSASATFVPKDLHTGGAEGIAKLLSDPDERAKIKETELKIHGLDLDWVFVARCLNHGEYEGMFLPEMIRKMTSLPAYVYKLSSKGRLEVGFDADICIFDADRIIDRSEYSNPHARAEGLDYVILGGEVVAENAVHNGKRNGKVILNKFY